MTQTDLGIVIYIIFNEEKAKRKMGLLVEILLLDHPINPVNKRNSSSWEEMFGRYLGYNEYCDIKKTCCPVMGIKTKVGSVE